MNDFAWLLSSSWFVGIITGIISGIIVYFITSYILENRKKRERKKRIAIANDAVLSLLKPHIANSGLPTIAQLEAIISSIARQYDVDSQDMNSSKMFCEDLVVEFVGNVYIPTDLKLERIEKLLDFIELSSMNAANESNATVQSVRPNPKVQIVGILAGLLCTTVALACGVVASWQDKEYFNLIVVIISISVLILSLMVYILAIKKSHRDDQLIRRLNSAKYRELKLQNHGTNFHTLYDHKFMFVDYFDDGEYNV